MVQKIHAGDAEYVLAGSVMLVNAGVAKSNFEVLKRCVLHCCRFELTYVIKSFEPARDGLGVISVLWISCVVVERVVNEEKSGIRSVRFVRLNTVRIIADVKERAMVALAVKLIAKIGQQVRAENLIFLVEARLIFHAWRVFEWLIKANCYHRLLKYFKVRCFTLLMLLSV